MNLSFFLTVFQLLTILITNSTCISLNRMTRTFVLFFSKCLLHERVVHLNLVNRSISTSNWLSSFTAAKTTSTFPIDTSCTSWLLSSDSPSILVSAFTSSSATKTSPIPRKRISHRHTSTATTKITLPTLFLNTDSRSESDNNNNNNTDFLYLNGEAGSEFDKNQKQKETLQNRRPKTGWNHNLPSNKSDFWQTNKDSIDSKKEKNYSQKQQQTSPLKTGWLHNRQPVSEVIQKLQKQQSGSSSTSTSISGEPVARLRLQQAMEQQSIDHRMVHPPTFHASTIGKQGIVVTEHVISVPLRRKASGDADGSSKQKIDVYFSIVEPIDTDEQYTFFRSLLQKQSTISASQRATMYVQQYAKLDTAESMVLYLQGGPGFGAPNPVTGLSFSSAESSWAATALGLGYKRIVLMDQRGTGKSSPITKQTLQILYPNLFLLDKPMAPTTAVISDFAESHREETKLVQDAVTDVTEYLAQFRADNIVWDAEDIKYALMAKPNIDTADGIEQAAAKTNSATSVNPWGCSLGQSYGGFCSMTYLSKVQTPPKVMLLTGGIAPMLSNGVMELYTSFCNRVKKRNMLFYQMYPGDVIPVHRIVQRLIQSPVPLPSGGTLTARRFLQIGMMLGSSPSNFAALHSIISNAFVQLPNSDIQQLPIEELQFRRSFLKEIDSVSSFDDAPIYYWMHESIYADGSNDSVGTSSSTNLNNPTNWGAHRAMENKIKDDSTVFDYEVTSKAGLVDKPTLFFGEMVFPWMVNDYAELSGIGLSAVAQALANKSDWPALYNSQQMKQVLQSGQTKVAAAVYYDDMYVDFDECMKVTAQGTGPLELCKVYITNDYQHSGLRDDGSTLFKKLHGMACGTIRTPS